MKLVKMRRANDLIYVEVFPVRVSTLPKLIGYELDVGRRDTSSIGGRFSYRLRHQFQGHWVWTNGKILTDLPQDETEIMTLVEKLWRDQPEIYGDLRRVKRLNDWQPTTQMRADFVADGLLPDAEKEITRTLRKDTQDLGVARIERYHETRGWVVKDQPAISMSIFSRIVHKQDLSSYANTLKTPWDLVGLWVSDKTSTLKGEITKIEGVTSEHRKRLLALTQREEMIELLKNAPDGEPVVRVLAGRNEYEYVAGALRLIIRPDDYRRFRINSRQATKSLRLEPAARFRLIEQIYEIAARRNLVDDAYTSVGFPDSFLTSADIGFTSGLRFGQQRTVELNQKSLLSCLHEYGVYRKSQSFEKDVPIRIGVVNALPCPVPQSFWFGLEKELRQLGFGIDVIQEENVRRTSRIELERAIVDLQQRSPHIVFAFLPFEQEDYEEEWGAYHNLKSMAVGRGIPSQIVFESTLDKRYALANIVLGLLGKTGNIPFILAEPLGYADLVVGLDIARERKKHLPGTISATAIARIYFGNGEFIRYVIHDTPLEGETVPESVLQALFPANDFKGKSVVIHRDGYFRGEEKRTLRDWGKNIGAVFHLVEVIKTGSPRLYSLRGAAVQQPPKGSAFKLSSHEALLVSSLPPFADATPQPLRIRTEAPFTIEQAIHSVLSLTLLHYGSMTPPRLPVTIHYSDRIAYLALRGIKPRDLEGSIPFWL